jgi:AcrR family transcriptional regulator
MPKLAAALGAGTMTLYGYVKNKEDLVDRIAEQIFQELEVPTYEDWRMALFAFFTDFRAAALTHPTLARLLATGRITIPAVFDILESSFQKMVDDGVNIEDAVRTFYAALTYTVGFVIWEIPRAHLQIESDYANQWKGLVSQLDPVKYPLLTGPAGDVAPTVASIGQFEWGLNRIIAG